MLDPPYIETVAKAHELAGFDRALLAFHSTTPDACKSPSMCCSITTSLKVMIAQRPGFTAPTLLARQLATLDQFYGGRVSLHVITGGNATELRQDGNTLDDKDERYARTDEFLDVVRLEWTSEKPFDYDGKYYRVEKGFSQVKPTQQGGIPILCRRRLRCRDRGRGQACRHFRAVGRILRPGARRDRAGAGGRGKTWTADAALQPVGAARSSPTPRRRHGQKADAILRTRHRAAGQDRLPQAGRRPRHRRRAAAAGAGGAGHAASTSGYGPRSPS